MEIFPEVRSLVNDQDKTVLVELVTEFICKVLNVTTTTAKVERLPEQPVAQVAQPPFFPLTTTGDTTTTQVRRYDVNSEAMVPFRALELELVKHYPHASSHGMIQAALDQLDEDLTENKTCEFFTRTDYMKWRRLGLAPASVLSYVSKMPVLARRTRKRKTQLTLAIG